MKIDRLLKDTGLAFVLRAAGAGFAFLLNIVIGRMLGASGAGLYFLALSAVSIAAVVTRLGFENTVLRFVASYQDAGDPGRARGTLRHALFWVGAGSALCSAVLILGAPLIATQLLNTPDVAPVLMAIGLGVLSMNAMTIFSEALKGLGHIRNAILINGVIYPIVALLMIYPAATLLGPAGAGLAYFGGTAVAALVGWLFWRRTEPAQSPLVAVEPEEMRKSARPLWVTNVAHNAILPWTPLVLLAVWGTTEEVGIFGVAMRVSLLVSFLLLTVIAVLSPRFATHHARGELAEVAALGRRFSLLTTLAASPLLLILIFAGDFVMGIFGPDFADGGRVLAILALGQGIFAATGPVGAILMMGGRERDMRNITLLSVVVVVILALVLTPSLTAEGAAIAAASAYAVSGVGLLLMVRFQFGIWAAPFFPKGPNER